MSDYLIPPELLKEASPGELEEIENAFKALKALESPLDYALYVTPTTQEYPHTRLISDILVALVEWRLYADGPGPASIVVDVTEDRPKGRRVHPVTGEEPLRKLMVSLPPQIGKSYIIGRHFASWFMTKYPEERTIYMSYAATLAQIYSRFARDNIASHPEFGVNISDTSGSVTDWELAEHEGGMCARGFGGVPTGKNGNMIIDDPFQDGAEALSETWRDYIWNQYNSSLVTRVHEDQFTVLLNTRWNEDDLSGRLQARERGKWFVLNIPAIAFEFEDEDGVSIDPETGTRDPLGRKPGEAICPSIATVHYYLEKKEADPFWFDAEFQGKPTGLSGGMCKDFSYYKKHVSDTGEVLYELLLGEDNSKFVSEKDCVRFSTIDTALKDTELSDFTVMNIWDMTPDKELLLREVLRERTTDHENWIRNHATNWEVRVNGIEEATVSYKIIQDMVIAGRITIWPLKADKNKAVRFVPAVNLLKRKIMLIDRDAPWRGTYESELKKFPRDSHDDMVDATSYGAVMRDMINPKEMPKGSDKNKLTGSAGRWAALADSEPEQTKSVMVVSA